MLLHGFYDKFPGGHGWSTAADGKDGNSWEFSETAAYDFDVNLAGKNTRLGQRERPQVVMQEGVPTHLFNVAAMPGSHHTFSMVTDICQHGPADWSTGVPVCM
jgi:hypothetical protein